MAYALVKLSSFRSQGKKTDPPTTELLTKLKKLSTQKTAQ